MPVIILSKSVRSTPQLCQLLRTGQVIAAPTETAYGLLADATSPRAVVAVVKLKGREPGKPIALVAADMNMVQRYFRVSRNELRLMKKFWPGPLTLLLKPKVKFPHAVIGPGGLVGVRVPRSKWLQQVSTELGVPLTATSANRARGATPYTAIAVRNQLSKHGLRYLVDGGRLPRRPTSTVIKLDKGKLGILRLGAVSRQRLSQVLKLKFQ